MFSLDMFCWKPVFPLTRVEVFVCPWPTCCCWCAARNPLVLMSGLLYTNAPSGELLFSNQKTALDSVPNGDLSFLVLRPPAFKQLCNLSYSVLIWIMLQMTQSSHVSTPRTSQALCSCKHTVPYKTKCCHSLLQPRNQNLLVSPVFRAVYSKYT